jgi:hypothetical protein
MQITPDELARMMRNAQADAHENAVIVVTEMAAGYVGTELHRLQQVITMHEVAAKRLREG